MKMETERALLRPWLNSDAETLFKYAGEETLCPNLEVGSDCPVRVMQLIKK